MESIGQKLRQTREEKGYTIEQIARDTHIAKRFIEALESEDFSVFPGDPYLIGFLRTHASYLGLDGQEMVNLYKNLKLQEQPAPIDELIVRTGPRPIVRIAIIAIVLAGLGVGGYFLFTSGVFSGDANADPPASTQTDDPEEGEAEASQVAEIDIPSDAYQLTEELVERTFEVGTAIAVRAGGVNHLLQIEDIGETVRLSVDTRTQDAAPQQAVVLDLDGDEEPDLQVTVRSVDPSANPASAVIRLDRDVRAEEAPEATAPIASETAGQAIGSTTESSRERDAQVIASFSEPEPYFVEIQFRGFSMFRYEVDAQPRQEQYFQAGQNFRVSVNDRFMFWVSNAGVSRFRVAGRDLTLGDAGEVAVGLLSWAQTEDDTQLLLLPVY